MMTKLLMRVNIVTEQELVEANKNFPLFHSNHEAYAVIKEEVEETEEDNTDTVNNVLYFWKQIKQNANKKQIKQTLEDIKSSAIHAACEAIQTAAMAQKAIDSMKNYKE